MSEKNYVRVEPGDVEPGDFLVTPGGRFEVTYRRHDLIHYRTPGGGEWGIHMSKMADFGLHFEREAPVTPRIPTVPFAHIIVGDRWHAVKHDNGDAGWHVADSESFLAWMEDDEVQALADGHGFEVVWPRPEPPRLEVGQVWVHEDGREWECRGMTVFGCDVGQMRSDGYDFDAVVTIEGLTAAGFRLKDGDVS